MRIVALIRLDLPVMGKAGNQLEIADDPRGIVQITAAALRAGMLIRNLTTGQRCKIVNLTEESLLPGAHLELDSRMGQTRIVLGDSREMAFAMHDEGYIELAPCTPFERSIAISHTENSNIVTSEGLFLPHMAGQFLYLDGWKKIRQITDAHSAILSDKAASSGTTFVPIVTMNEIEISGENLALTTLEVDYTPRVR